MNRSAISCGADLYTLARAALRPFKNASYVPAVTVPPTKPAAATAQASSSGGADGPAAVTDAAGAADAANAGARADPQVSAPATTSAEAGRSVGGGDGEAEGVCNGREENGSLQGGLHPSDSNDSLEGREGSVGEGEGDELARDKSVAMHPRDEDELMGEEPSAEDSCPFKLSTSGRFQGETPTEPIANSITDALPRNFHSIEIVHKDLPTLVLDWSEDVGPSHEYDLSGIEEVPEAREPGKLEGGGLFGRVKKECVTLRSCLDSFLKEEPLGPEDMW